MLSRILTALFISSAAFIVARPALADLIRSDTGQCLQVDRSSGEAGRWRNLVMRDCTAGADQQFSLEGSTIRSTVEGGSWCVDINRGAAVGFMGRGRELILWHQCHGGPNQTWFVPKTGVISAYVDDKSWCIDAVTGNAIVWDECHGGQNQLWSGLRLHKRPVRGRGQMQFASQTLPRVRYEIPSYPIGTTDGGIHFAALASTHLIYDVVAPGTRAAQSGACPPEVTARLFGAGVATECVERVRTTDNEISYFIASDPYRVVLAFRGRNSDLQANMDLTSRGGALVGNPGFPTETTHFGLAWAVNDVYADIKAQMLAQGARNKEVVFTGHSMGGMLIGYTVFRLMRDNSPLVSNASFITLGAAQYAGRVCSQAPGDGLFNLRFREMAAQVGMDTYAIEMIGDVYLDDWADGAATCTDRVGKPIDYDISEARSAVADLDRSERHRPEIYYDIAYQRRYTAQ